MNKYKTHKVTKGKKAKDGWSRGKFHMWILKSQWQGFEMEHLTKQHIKVTLDSLFTMKYHRWADQFDLHSFQLDPPLNPVKRYADDREGLVRLLVKVDVPNEDKNKYDGT